LKIEAYSFGRMVIEGKEYTSDLIVYPDRVDAGWWREEGHLLKPVDLKEVLTVSPRVLVVGTGCYGVMKISPELPRYLEERGIELIARPTSEAVLLFNQLSEKKQVVGAFHLTC